MLAAPLLASPFEIRAPPKPTYAAGIILALEIAGGARVGLGVGNFEATKDAAGHTHSAMMKRRDPVLEIGDCREIRGCRYGMHACARRR